MMKIYLFVGIGGALGSVLRYIVSVISLHIFGGLFPYGTIIVNFIGSLALGWFTSRFIQANKISPHIAGAVGTGLIGSFTTLSTLSVDFVMLLEHEHLMLALLYLIISVIGGLLLALLGLRLGNKKDVGDQL